METKRTDDAFRDEILSKCYAALERRGFERFRSDGVDWPLHDGFHCWVGLNTGLHPTHLNINPFVGLHVVPLMKLSARLSGRKYNRGYATFAIHMGELRAVSKEPIVQIRVDQSEAFVDDEIDRLADFYITSGLDYARSIASYERLLPLLKQRVSRLGGYPEDVACCLYLMGRKAQAKEFVEGMLNIGIQGVHFESFAIPFLEMLSGESGTPHTTHAS